MSLITITFDETSIPKFDKLPAGAFGSSFPSPPDGQTRDVISINARGVYTVQIVSPNLALEDAVVTPPVKLLKSDPGQLTLEVNASRLPAAQSYGTAAFTVGGAPVTLGFLVNPSSLLVPIAVSVKGEITVNEEDVPIGIHFNPAEHWFSVWTAGGYNFGFSLPSQEKVFFQGVKFNDPPGPLSYEISADGLTVWMRNNHLQSNPDVVAVGFDLVLEIVGGTQGGSGTITVDPTIINNPINQGGSGGNARGKEPRREPVAAGAAQRATVAA